MIFVDPNASLYAVGRDHPLRPDARRFFDHALGQGSVLTTSAQVLQEMLHAYRPVGRTDTLDLALELVRRATTTVWPLEPDDVRLARGLAETHRGLGARDLLHLACCLRRDVDDLQTYDRALRAAFERR